MYGGDDGARTRDLCRDSEPDNRNLLKQHAMDGSILRYWERSETVIVPLLFLRFYSKSLSI